MRKKVIGPDGRSQGELIESEGGLEISQRREKRAT
jgi:hypothetical protein